MVRWEWGWGSSTPLVGSSFSDGKNPWVPSRPCINWVWSCISVIPAFRRWGQSSKSSLATWRIQGQPGLHETLFQTKQNNDTHIGGTQGSSVFYAPTKVKCVYEGDTEECGVGEGDMAGVADEVSGNPNCF